MQNPGQYPNNMNNHREKQFQQDDFTSKIIIFFDKEQYEFTN